MNFWNKIKCFLLLKAKLTPLDKGTDYLWQIDNASPELVKGISKMLYGVRPPNRDMIVDKNIKLIPAYRVHSLVNQGKIYPSKRVLIRDISKAIGDDWRNIAGLYLDHQGIQIVRYFNIPLPPKKN